MDVIKHYVGNTSPSLYYTFMVEQVPTVSDPRTLVPYPIPTGSTVKIYVRELGEGTMRVDGGDCTIVNPAAVDPGDVDAGKVRYDWQTADVALPAGEFVVWLSVHFASPAGAKQDSPEFIWLLQDHATASPAGTYTSVSQLKDFTGLDDLKQASDEYLAENIIPRAEAWLQAFGPFTSNACPAVKLAANMLAEFIFMKVNPKLRNRIAAGTFKSESIGNYSYTLTDVAGGPNSGEWEALLDEVGIILTPCLSAEAVVGMAPKASSVWVFDPLPGFTLNETGDRIEYTFDVNLETSRIRGWLQARQPWTTWDW